MFARMVLSSIRHNGRRTAVALAAVLVPAALVTAVANFVLDARAKMTRELRRRGANVVVTGPVDPAALAGPGRVVSPRWTAPCVLEDGPEILLVAVDPAAARVLHPGWIVEGTRLERGALVGSRLAARLRIRPGDTFLGRRVDGVVETGDADDFAVFVRREALPEAALARVDLRIDGPIEEVERAAADIEARFPGVEARVQRALAASEGALLSQLALAFALVCLLVGAVSALSMATSLAAAVAQRRRELALLRALGAGDRRVASLLLAEAGILLAAGAALGTAAGLGLSDWIGRSVFGQGVDVRPAAPAAGILACVLIAAAAAALPVRQALSLDPAQTLKEE